MLLDVETPDLKNSRWAGDIACSSRGLILGVVSLPRDTAGDTGDGACEFPIAAANTKAHTRRANSVDSNVETDVLIVVSSLNGAGLKTRAYIQPATKATKF